MKVSDLIVKTLEANDVKYIFGVLGDIETEFAESLRNSKIKFIAAKNEKSASFMADIYARISKGVGVCFSTVGPGATNLVSGLANATQDRSSVVGISDQMPTKEMILNSHQYVNYEKLFHPETGVTKWNRTFKNADEVPQILKEAFQQATAEPKGAVHLGVPVDVLNANVDPKSELLKWNLTPAVTAYSDTALQSVYEKIKKGKGIIFVGDSVKRSGAHKAFADFIHASQLPVISSFRGKGSFNENDGLYLGTISRHLHDIFKDIFEKSDFILTVGYDFIEGVKPSVFGGIQKVINVDLVSNLVPGHYEPACNLFGDLTKIFSSLASKSYERNLLDGNHIREQIRQAIYGNLDMDVYPPRPHKIMEAINATYRSKTTLICDVGLNKYYAGLLLRVQEDCDIVFSNGMSSMAFSSGVLAAKLARPDRDVIAITGDGGFLMNPQEISTCVRYNIPLTVLILNNSGLGLVEKKQRATFGHTYEVNFGNPDYTKFAEAFGAEGHSIRSWAQLEGVLAETRGNKKVNIIDVPVDYDEGL